MVTNAWNSIGQVVTESLNINVSSNAGVAIKSPAAGATVASPVQFVASALAPSGRVIDSMRIYVDSVTAYTVYAPSLNTAVALPAGVHNINMQAWDNTGTIYIQDHVGCRARQGGLHAETSERTVGKMKRLLEILTNVRIATGEIGGTVCLIFLVAFGMYEAWRSFILPLLR